MPGRKFLTWLFMGFAVMAAVMAAESLYSQNRLARAMPPALFYLAGTRTPAAAVPADTHGLIVWQGVTPQKFAGRDVFLLYRLSEIPQTFPVLFEAIQADMGRWQEQGNRIAGVYVDYDVETPDWPALGRLLEELKAALGADARINLLAKAKWFEDGIDSPALDETGKATSFMAFDMDDAVKTGQAPGDFVKTLEKIRFPFYLVVDKSVDVAAFHRAHTAAAKFFAGFIIALGSGT